MGACSGAEAPALCDMDGEGHTGVCWTPAAPGFSFRRYILSHPVYVVSGSKPRASRMLGRSFTN